MAWYKIKSYHRDLGNVGAGRLIDEAVFEASDDAQAITEATNPTRRFMSGTHFAALYSPLGKPLCPIEVPGA
jgi:hypothetical protein